MSVPKGPRCIIGDSGCICFDPTLEKEKQDYALTFEECKNQIAITPEYYNILEQWAAKHCK